MEIQMAGLEGTHSLTASFKRGCSPTKLLEQNNSALGGGGGGWGMGVGLNVKT